MFSILKSFEGYSGLKLNKDKMEAYWLGSRHNYNEPMKILGIYFNHNSRLKNELNFEENFK